MKLIYAIIHEKDSENVIEALNRAGLTATRMASTGGFLRFGNITLLIGTEPENVDRIIQILDTHCSPSETNQHAATIFVVDLPVYRKI
jgi:uncharacterized protein YaaQ